ncbi:MAG: AEC family transporter [Firmicutes bacterium]|nr:AEC family transporter [Bacillota bacterium]
MIALLLLRKIVSLFIIMLSGTLLVKLGLMKSSDSKVLSQLSLYLVVPVVIINAFMIEYSPDILKGLLLSSAAAFVILLIMVAQGSVCRRILKLDPVEEASVIYSNAGNLIIPIVISVLGPEWVVYTSPFICIELVFMWSHGKKLICREKGFDLKKVLTNFNIVSVMIGIVFFALQIKLPPLISETMDSISALLGPLAMVVTGMLIGGMELKKIFTYRRTMLMVFLRLIAFPLVVFLILKFCGLQSLAADGDKILLISFFATISPTASTITQMSQVYGLDAEYASAIGMLGTLCCIVTMPLYVMLYQL